MARRADAGAVGMIGEQAPADAGPALPVRAGVQVLEVPTRRGAGMAARRPSV